MKVLNDKFYTPIKVAKKCLESIEDFDSYDVVIEPSAGNGSFSNLIENCIAYDIEPEGENIIKQDFLKIENIKGEHKLFIGNPPFGSRSSLAKDFIRHCIELGAETIAFILPNTFNKFQNQKVFEDYKLKKIIPLDCDYVANGVKYFVPSSFFIITKRDCEDLKKKKTKELKSFYFLSRGDSSADFSINGNTGKIKEIKDITNSKAEHYIKVSKGYNIEEIKSNLKNTKFSFYSSINGKLSWLGQDDIKEAYFEQYESKRCKEKNFF